MATLLPLILNEFIEDEDMDDDEGDIVFLLMQEMLLRPRTSVPKVSGFCDLVLHTYSDVDFKSDFRIRRHTFETLLIELTPTIQYADRPNGKPPLPPNKQLLIFIWYLANQDSIREIARLFGVSKSTVHRCLRRVSTSMWSTLKNRVICWPDKQQQDIISQRIEEARHLPGVIGLIDGTHIRLTGVPDGDSTYMNRKKFPSKQLQLVVTDTLLITDAYVGWPGSVHDARVYSNSPIYQALLRDRDKLGPNKFLIGDGAYPLSSFLMTPFRQTGNLTEVQKFYNKKVSSIRQAVERANAHLKGQFRRLKDLTCGHIKDACYIIMSACILHNLCVLSGEDLSDYLQEQDGNNNPVVNNYPALYRNGAAGIQKRQQLVQYLRGLANA